MENKKFTLEEKFQIALEEASRESGRSDLKLDNLLTDIFPNTEGTTSDEEIDGGDSARLEFLINLEMKIAQDSFRLDPDDFFRTDLTLGDFAKLIHESEKNGPEGSLENIEELTQEDSQDLLEDEDSEESSEEPASALEV